MNNYTLHTTPHETTPPPAQALGARFSGFIFAENARDHDDASSRWQIARLTFPGLETPLTYLIPSSIGKYCLAKKFAILYTIQFNLVVFARILIAQKPCLLE